MSLTFHDAIQDGSLGILRALIAHELEYSDSTEIIRLEKFGFQLLNEAAEWGQLKILDKPLQCYRLVENLTTYSCHSESVFEELPILSW
jgi:hypothetical protein